MNEFNPFLLIPPAVMAFLALAMGIVWNVDRKQSSLLSMALGIFSTSIALSIQCVLPPDQIAIYAVYTGVIYLSGAWLAGRSIALKFKALYPARIALLASLATLSGLYYFSRWDESLATRSYILSVGLGVLHILPIFNVLERKPKQDSLDTCLYWCYLVFCIYTVARPLTLLIFEQIQINNLVKSVYWFVTLLGSILFCMTFAFLLLASSIRSTLKQLHVERDHDPLTRLLNRRAFEEAFERLYNTKHSQPCALLVADIDHFKHINDTWGHDYGDQVLRNIAQCLRHGTRDTDLVARYGGEEFVLVMPHTSASTAALIAQRMQQHMALMPLHHPDQQPITISVGITQHQPGERFQAAFHRADQALYQAKHAGRDCIFIHSQEHVFAARHA